MEMAECQLGDMTRISFVVTGTYVTETRQGRFVFGSWFQEVQSVVAWQPEEGMHGV